MDGKTIVASVQIFSDSEERKMLIDSIDAALTDRDQRIAALEADLKSWTETAGQFSKRARTAEMKVAALEAQVASQREQLRLLEELQDGEIAEHVRLAEESASKRASSGPRPPHPGVTGECHWTEDSEGNYDTACGEAFTLISGTFEDNKIKFCCYCGKGLVPVAYVDPWSKEETS